MIRKICAIYDARIEAFGNPMGVNHTGAAMRSFADEVNRKAPENGFYNHPEDYDLWYIADYNDETGEFIPLENGKQRLARGIDVKKENQQ